MENITSGSKNGRPLSLITPAGEFSWVDKRFLLPGPDSQCHNSVKNGLTGVLFQGSRLGGL
jgi:hypothetical protein